MQDAYGESFHPVGDNYRLLLEVSKQRCNGATGMSGSLALALSYTAMSIAATV
jgi:hypothetical protein